jgi:hypothetical protein
VVRGGFGIYNDRLTAAFMNTVFSNYPILREIEVTVPSRMVPIANAFTSQTRDGQAIPFNEYLPMRVVSAGSYGVRDGLGNIAETFEFRAIDPDLVTLLPPVERGVSVGLRPRPGVGAAIQRLLGKASSKRLLSTNRGI